MSSLRPRPVVLCIVDGFGERADPEANAVKKADTPALDQLYSSCPHSTLGASGEAVGLPIGQAGNGEAGHTVLGAGRVILSDRSRIDQAVAAGKLGTNPTLHDILNVCWRDRCRLHLFGLLSDGGVHSQLDHLIRLLEIAEFQNTPVVVHAFLDGRDTPPRSAHRYLERLQRYIEGSKAIIGTLAGRYYAMDRDQHWDRTYQAFHAIVRDKVLGDSAPSAPTPEDALADWYENGLGDESFVPVRIGNYSGIAGGFAADFGASPTWTWTGEEAGFAFNFRADRMRQLVQMLTRQGLPTEVADDLLVDRGKPVHAFREHCLATMADYGGGLEVPVAFDKQAVEDSFAELVARAGLTQLRCAESEKYPHVTYFFNGGREQAFEGEERIVVPSPKVVDSYDQKPEMSAAKVADVVTRAVEEASHDVIVVNFSNPDVVGHSGKLEAAIAAVEAVDAALGRIADAVRHVGGAMIVTASHGNCERMTDEHGDPHTAHTDSPVPFIYLNEGDPGALREGGGLCDVAPTLLDVMGIEPPEAMTGKSLRVVK